MGVDLEALKAELEAAGCIVELRHGNEIIVREDTESNPTWANVWGDGTGSFDGEYDWTLLDIIRRAVSPAPAGEELRARIAKAIASVRNRRREINAGEPATFDYERADAVLRALNGEGER